MTKVNVQNIPAKRILEIVKELKLENIKFTFSYAPGTWDIENGHVPNHTIFSFSKEKDATYFILKWKLI